MNDIKTLEKVNKCEVIACKCYIYLAFCFRYQEPGVTFDIDACQYTFRGTLTLIPADNLASQYLGDYKALNAALRKCRHCLAV